MIIPEGYIIEKFFMYCRRPIYQRSSGTYVAECPYCHEGKSAGKKRRFFYLPTESRMFCQNGCGSKRPLDFIKEVSGMETGEVLHEAEEYVTPISDVIRRQEPEVKRENKESLPHDSINLFDRCQTVYYKDNTVVRDALALITRRRLDIAINKPRALWISLTDMLHKNRLCFPFYDFGTKYDISYYQTRAMYPQDEVDGRKYISKLNADKTIFNMQNINSDIDSIYIIEGPIDSMFVRNGVGVAGTYLTELQQTLLSHNFPLHKHVYVYDNQWLDKAARERTAKMIEKGYTVFIWPRHLRVFKDINELCIAQKINEIPYKYINKYSCSGIKAQLALQEIQKEIQKEIQHLQE